MAGTLPRLLLGVAERSVSTLRGHRDVHGPLPDLRKSAPEEILEQVERAGLRGHGGASFPAAKKMRAVASRRKPRIVVANAAEGEPASRKDRVLLREAPHLVLDGVAIAARAVGAGEALIAFPKTDSRSARILQDALRDRRDLRLRGEPSFELVGVPERYLSGQETALVNVIGGGRVTPTFGTRPFERGVRQRPTLVSNVETLAHMALILRHGAGWFRELGTARDPGTALVTVSGAVASAGVYEIAFGTPLDDVLATAGVHEELIAVLLGGYFGSWVPAGAVPRLRLDGESLAAHDASLGAGVIVALAGATCPVAETVRVADYFAAQNAGQCGPCVNGLSAIADTVQRLSTGTAPPGARADLERWATELPGRGACHFPDGAVRFIASALRIFDREFDDHARHGRCERCSEIPVLPAPLIAA
jgi:NADH:ubiquinone oxidoreductase subunit F (NADH-binding)